MSLIATAIQKGIEVVKLEPGLQSVAMATVTPASKSLLAFHHFLYMKFAIYASNFHEKHLKPMLRLRYYLVDEDLEIDMEASDLQLQSDFDVRHLAA